MRMQKRRFRIGDLAKKLNVERFVIRFWEKEFNLKTYRSYGKQRFYDETDYTQFARIKELLYEKGFTIAGAKKQLIEDKQASASIVASKKTTITPAKQPPNEPFDQQRKIFAQQIINLQKKLQKLRELL